MSLGELHESAEPHESFMSIIPTGSTHNIGHRLDTRVRRYRRAVAFVTDASNAAVVVTSALGDIERRHQHLRDSWLHKTDNVTLLVHM